MKITKDYPRLTRLDNCDYKLNGNLVACDDLVIKLDGRLTVGGSLDLSNTQITALPDNLTVGGDLDLSNTQITDERAAREQVQVLRPWWSFLKRMRRSGHIIGNSRIRAFTIAC